MADYYKILFYANDLNLQLLQAKEISSKLISYTASKLLNRKSAAIENDNESLLALWVIANLCIKKYKVEIDNIFSISRVQFELRLLCLRYLMS